jgi:excisionase family DNA binding protein
MISSVRQDSRDQAPYIGDPFAALIAEVRLLRAAVERQAGPKGDGPSGKPWTIRDASKHLGVSDAHLRRLIKNGEIRGMKLGWRRLIPDDEVRRLAAGV